MRGQWFFASLPGRGETSFLATPGLGREFHAGFEMATAITGDSHPQVSAGEFDSALCYFTGADSQPCGACFHGVLRLFFRPFDFAGRPGSLVAHGFVLGEGADRGAGFDPFALAGASNGPEHSRWFLDPAAIAGLDPEGQAPALPLTCAPRGERLATRIERIASRLRGLISGADFEELLAAYLVALLPRQRPILLVFEDPTELCPELMEALFLCVPPPERPRASFTTFRLDVPRDPAGAGYPFRCTFLPRDSYSEDRVLNRRDVRARYRVLSLGGTAQRRLVDLGGAHSAAPPRALHSARGYARLILPAIFGRGQEREDGRLALARVHGWGRRVLRDGAGGGRAARFVRGPLARFIRLRHGIPEGEAERGGSAAQYGEALSRSEAEARAMLALSPRRAMSLFNRAIHSRLARGELARALDLGAEAALEFDAASTSMILFSDPRGGEEMVSLAALATALGERMAPDELLGFVRNLVAEQGGDASARPVVRTILQALLVPLERNPAGVQERLRAAHLLRDLSQP